MILSILNQAFVVFSETSFYTQLLIPGPGSLHLFFTYNLLFSIVGDEFAVGHDPRWRSFKGIFINVFGASIGRFFWLAAAG